MARAIGHALSVVCGGQHRYPSTQSVRVRPIRIGMGSGWCAPHAHRQRGKTRGVETSHLRVPRVVFRNIASTRAGSVSTRARIGGTRTRMVAAA